MNKRSTVSRAWPLLPAMILATTVSADAGALVWPDVLDRVERAMHSTDREERRKAARKLPDIGKARGTPLVLEALGDADDEVRIEAAKAAVILRAVGAADAVLPWLGDKEPKVRLTACEVLRAMPSPRAVPQLARALQDSDPNVRAAAAEALGAQKNGEAVAPLMGKLDDQNPPVRIHVIRALAHLGDKRAVVPLVGKVSDSVPEVRASIARALGSLDDQRAVSALVLLLRDAVNDVRIEAIRALARLRATAAVDPIAQQAQDRVREVRHAALDALGKIGGDAAATFLVSLLGVGEDAGSSLEPTPVRRALVTLGQGCVPLVSRVLDRPDSPAAATSAAYVLASLGARAEEKKVRAALERGAIPVPAALFVLARIGGPETLPVVLEFISDQSPAVRHQALLSARELTNPEKPDGRAVEPITFALKDARISAEDRLLLVEVLGRTGAPRARDILLGILPTKDVPLRLAAIDALGSLGVATPGGGSAVAAGVVTGPRTPLVTLLSDPLPEVRLHAALALAKVGGAEDKQDIEKRLLGDEENDAFALFVALAGISERHPGEPAAMADLFAVRSAGQRDMVLETLGRMPKDEVPALLYRLAKGASVDDRRMAATMLARHRGRAATLPSLSALAQDPSSDVRAQAAFALGTAGGSAEIPLLHSLGAQDDTDVTIDALAGIARITAREKKKDVAARELCPFVTDTRVYVRLNALSGLALAGARCEDAARERRALEDESASVRGAAARALGNAPSDDDRRALARCRDEERVSEIAERCEAMLVAPFAPKVSASSVTVYVVADRETPPKPLTPYALLLPDGLVRVGISDRRGAVTDPAAPDGVLTLLPPSAIAR